MQLTWFSMYPSQGWRWLEFEPFDGNQGAFTNLTLYARHEDGTKVHPLIFFAAWTNVYGAAEFERISRSRSSAPVLTTPFLFQAHTHITHKMQNEIIPCRNASGKSESAATKHKETPDFIREEKRLGKSSMQLCILPVVTRVTNKDKRSFWASRCSSMPSKTSEGASSSQSISGPFKGKHADLYPETQTNGVHTPAACSICRVHSIFKTTHEWYCFEGGDLFQKMSIYLFQYNTNAGRSSHFWGFVHCGKQMRPDYLGKFSD